MLRIECHQSRLTVNRLTEEVNFDSVIEAGSLSNSHLNIIEAGSLLNSLNKEVNFK